MNATDAPTPNLPGARATRLLPESITTVFLYGSVQLAIDVGAEAATVEVEAAAGALAHVDVSVEDDALAIDLDPAAAGHPVTVRVRVPHLDLVENHGSGAIAIGGRIEADNLTLRTEGPGGITVAAGGVVDLLDVEQNGEGTIDTRSLPARRASLVALRDSTGDIRALVTDHLHVDAWGTGTVRISGAPAKRQCHHGDNGAAIVFEDAA